MIPTNVNPITLADSVEYPAMIAPRPISSVAMLCQTHQLRSALRSRPHPRKHDTHTVVPPAAFPRTRNSASMTKHVVVRRMQRNRGMFTRRRATNPALTLNTKTQPMAHDLRATGEQLKADVACASSTHFLYVSNFNVGRGKGCLCSGMCWWWANREREQRSSAPPLPPRTLTTVHMASKHANCVASKKKGHLNWYRLNTNCRRSGHVSTRDRAGVHCVC